MLLKWIMGCARKTTQKSVTNNFKNQQCFIIETFNNLYETYFFFKKMAQPLTPGPVRQDNLYETYLFFKKMAQPLTPGPVRQAGLKAEKTVPPGGRNSSTWRCCCLRRCDCHRCRLSRLALTKFRGPPGRERIRNGFNVGQAKTD